MNYITCFSRRPASSPPARIRVLRGSTKNGSGGILATIRVAQIIVISVVIDSIPLLQLSGAISLQDEELRLSVGQKWRRSLGGEIGLVGEEDAVGFVLVGRVDPRVADEVDGGVLVAGDVLEG